MTDTIRELMSQYDANRAKWVDFYGTDEGFDAWFTKQVMPKSIRDPHQDIDAALSEIVEY